MSDAAFRPRGKPGKYEVSTWNTGVVDFPAVNTAWKSNLNKNYCIASCKRKIVIIYTVYCMLILKCHRWVVCQIRCDNAHRTRHHKPSLSPWKARFSAAPHSFTETTEACCCCGLTDASSVLTFCTCADELKHVLIINIKQTHAVTSLWNIFSLLCKFLLLGKMLHTVQHKLENSSHMTHEPPEAVWSVQNVFLSALFTYNHLTTTVTSRWLDEDLTALGRNPSSQVIPDW